MFGDILRKVDTTDLRLNQDVHTMEILQVLSLQSVEPRKKSLHVFAGICGNTLGGGFKHFYFHTYLGKISILTNIFQWGCILRLKFMKLEFFITRNWHRNIETLPIPSPHLPALEL